LSRDWSSDVCSSDLVWDGEKLTVTVRNLEHVSTRDMMIDDVPEDALPPREPGEPVAPVARVPPVDPPVHRFRPCAQAADRALKWIGRAPRRVRARAS